MTKNHQRYATLAHFRSGYKDLFILMNGHSQNNKRKKKKIKSTQTLAEDKKESTTTEKSVQDSPSMINEDRTAKLVDAPTTQREHVTHDSSVNGTVIIPETAGTNEIRDITQVVTEGRKQ